MVIKTTKMSYLRILHCTLCVKHGTVNLCPKSMLLKNCSSKPIQQLANISLSCHLSNNSPLTTQAVTTSTKKKSKNVPQDTRMWKETPTHDVKNNLVQYSMMLSKFRLTSLVVMTSMAGYTLAPAPFDLTTFALCTVGTGLVSSAANSINQYHEVPFDAQMSRTKNRVLVKGLLEPVHAISFAAASSITGLSVLYFGVNPLTAALGAGNLILYSFIYTPLKRISITNTWLGSVVGAIPPLMGWAGCAGGLDAGALVLSAVLYSWQFPHFNALSWNLRPDYSRAGYRMMAVTDPALCRRVALRHTGFITATCVGSSYLGVTNMWFALESLPLNIYFMYLAWQFYKKSDSGSSRKLFRFSLIHLPALMLLMLVNKKYWSSSKTEEHTDTLKIQDVNKHPEFAKGITVLPRRPVVAAQDSNIENNTNA
ncbi:protoheme IX farnesyltransferase, mitochondrial [Vanessa cardui]|uniref:protoheme IX farnesyltransferase, mitochondrial n=1 Tax=Vanessa cardui TaxID=171605 RepID=UPI001F12C454|nr:protoheme IX farnesyltransferase, mitochondrial [Vanessa cardui]XP_046964739.1 protoheme IX farnesyltransferase, mitochondrial [Vanessa cardui]